VTPMLRADHGLAYRLGGRQQTEVRVRPEPEGQETHRVLS